MKHPELGPDPSPRSGWISPAEAASQGEFPKPWIPKSESASIKNNLKYLKT